jgi:hypothetical protein
MKIHGNKMAAGLTRYWNRNMVGRLLLLGGVSLMVSLLLNTMGLSQSGDLDSDGDGMSDAYELFFGLNPTNPTDAGLDYDGDFLSNLEEKTN